MLTLVLATAAGIGGVLGRATAAGPPPDNVALSYSGMLLEDGAAVTMSRSIGLALWTRETGGTVGLDRACNVDPTSTPVQAGHFTVALPAACVDAVRENPELWVAITVGSTELPRTRLTAVPYAIEADHAVRTIVENPLNGESLSMDGTYCGSTGAEDGAVTASGLTGYRAVARLCRAACGGSPTAHGCSATEVIASETLGITVPPGSWYTTGTHDGGGGITADCAGWTQATGSFWGHMRHPDQFLTIDHCDVSHPIACCD